jgi:hypothetical protein
LEKSLNELTGEQPLRLALPTCYQHLLEQFALDHLHPYDVKASVIPEEGGYLFLLRYGEGWTQGKQQYFANDLLGILPMELTNYFKETAKACKKALIADYFKMVKP